MGKTLKLAIVLFVINFAIFAVGDALHVNDFVLYLFILPVSITVSVILLIIAAIKNARNNYLAKDDLQRRQSRKKSFIILGCVVAGLLIAYVTFMFACGYKIPGRDRHKNWPYFPGSSNPEMVLAPIPNLYIYNIEPLQGTPYYLVHFTRDSVMFNDVNTGGRELQNFGIMDNKGNFKIEYQKTTLEFIDGDRIIVKENTYGDEQKLPETCDIIDIKTLTKTQDQVNKIPLPATREEFDESYGTEQGQARFKAKYQTEFFRNLSGVRSVELSSYYDSGNYRGYSLYKDAAGKLYKTVSYDDNSQLDMLSPQVTGYTSVKNTFGIKTIAPNIKQSGESIVLYNEANGGYGSSGLFYEYHQTWLLYYSAAIGTNVTSFKLEGGEKNDPYTTFYQLNKVTQERDTLVFVAENKIYKLHKK